MSKREVYTCDTCNKDYETTDGYRCQSCQLDFCKSCALKDEKKGGEFDSRFLRDTFLTNNGYINLSCNDNIYLCSKCIIEELEKEQKIKESTFLTLNDILKVQFRKSEEALPLITRTYLSNKDRKVNDNTYVDTPSMIKKDRFFKDVDGKIYIDSDYRSNRNDKISFILSSFGGSRTCTKENLLLQTTNYISDLYESYDWDDCILIEIGD